MCALGAARLCPSYRKVDPKSIASRVKVELLPEEEPDDAALQIKSEDGTGTLLVETKDEFTLSPTVKKELDAVEDIASVKTEHSPLDW